MFIIEELDDLLGDGTLLVSTAVCRDDEDVFLVSTTGEYTTIQAAINAATAGDVIQVSAGTYTEQISLNKQLKRINFDEGDEDQWIDLGWTPPVGERFTLSAFLGELGIVEDHTRLVRADLTAFEIALPAGDTVPLSSIAAITEARGWGTITRRNGLRTLTVSADVDGRIGNADAITAQLSEGFLPDLVATTPRLTFEIGGQAANSTETVASILRGFLVGLVGIYLVLSFQFRSYLEPLVVMITIPLAFLGVIWGHVLMGYNISMPSLVGAASLAGIVVNNAILLVGVINTRRAEGLSAALAAGEAVRSRFRPIFVSVSTTIMGMAPLLLETSTQAQTLKPLVISVVFGLLAATVLILVVLPAFYAALEDVRGNRRGD